MDYTITVKEIMSYGIRTMEATQTLAEVGTVLQRIGHEGYPIVRDGVLVGLLTSRDLNRALAHEQEHLTLGDIMLGNVVSLVPDDSLEHALHLMQSSGWGQLPVLEADQIIGLVTRSDIIHALVLRPANDSLTFSETTLMQTLGTDSLKLLKSIGMLAESHQINAFVVGGVVRDLFLERANDDVDRVSPQEYREVLNAAYALLIKAHKSIDTMQHNEWRSSFSRGWDR